MTSSSEVRRTSQELAGDVARLADEVARTSERLAKLLRERADAHPDPTRADHLRRAAARAEEFVREEHSASRRWRRVHASDD